MAVQVYSERLLESKKIIEKLGKEFVAVYKAKRNPDFFARFEVAIFPKEEKRLGFCQKTGYSNFLIGISEGILSENVSFESMKDVVGHEIAHMIAISEFNFSGHGEPFKLACKIIEVENNKANANKDFYDKIDSSNSVMSKIKKLLALSESANKNESQSALIKARQLMKDYGVHSVDADENKIYTAVLDEYKRFTTEMSVLSAIIRKITGVFALKSSRYPNNVFIIHGNKSEVEIAEYLYHYLKKELADQYENAKRTMSTRSGAKKSFYLGVYSEMHQRFEAQEAQRHDEWALLIQNEKETERKAKGILYSNTKFSTSYMNTNVRHSGAYSSGKETGKNVRINQGLYSGNNNSGKPLRLS